MQITSRGNGFPVNTHLLGCFLSLLHFPSPYWGSQGSLLKGTTGMPIFISETAPADPKPRQKYTHTAKPRNVYTSQLLF